MDRECVVTGKPRVGSGFRVGLGIVGFLTVIALALSPLLTPVERDFTRSKASFSSNHKYVGISITGSMTLNEVEKTTGVPARYIVESLKLPESISIDEKPGRLKRKHGFEIHNVREIIKEYKSRK